MDWNTSKEDLDLISKIADRACADKAHFVALGGSRRDLMMDLAAVHGSGCPLRLSDMLNGRDFDFWHDLGGIRRHINRETGELEGFFLPRFSNPEHERANAEPEPGMGTVRCKTCGQPEGPQGHDCPGLGRSV